MTVVSDVQPSSHDGLYHCPKCDKGFKNRQALGGHWTSHLPTHISNRKKAKTIGRPPGSKNKPRQTHDKVEALPAREVVDAVLEAIFPDKKVPIRYLGVVMAWIDVTETLLKAVEE